MVFGLGFRGCGFGVLGFGQALSLRSVTFVYIIASAFLLKTIIMPATTIAGYPYIGCACLHVLYVYIYIYIYVCTYIHTYIHTYR